MDSGGPGGAARVPISGGEKAGVCIDNQFEWRSEEL